MSAPTTEHLDQRLERLETTTQTILAEMRKGFDAHDEHLASIDKHLIEHDSRLAHIDSKLVNIDSHLADHDARFVDILSHLSDHDARFLRDVESRVEKLELKLKAA